MHPADLFVLNQLLSNLTLLIYYSTWELILQEGTEDGYKIAGVIYKVNITDHKNEEMKSKQIKRLFI